MPSESSDPLRRLPAELVLRVLGHLDPPALAALTRCSQAWHNFIDGSTNQNTIYYKHTEHPDSCCDLTFLLRSSGSHATFTDYLSPGQCRSWKELCKRQTLLARNWQGSFKNAGGVPLTRASLIATGRPWRFRADFERRIIMSTQEEGGITVVDMDTNRLLWQKDQSEVRPYAHLEYSNGWAVWDRWGDSIEVWRAKDGDPDTRGHFEQAAILAHGSRTRGFHLMYPTLCVVSPSGQGFIYDFSNGRPKRQLQMSIERGAMGHLHQDHDTVLYSMGRSGYHFHSKSTGAFLGAIDSYIEGLPSSSILYHKRSSVEPSIRNSQNSALLSGPDVQPQAPRGPCLDRLVSLDLEAEPYEAFQSAKNEVLQGRRDKWGAGMTSGDVFVGISLSGRLLICSDWPGAIRSDARARETMAVVEFECSSERFEFGGWLSIHNNRVLFEVEDTVNILTLPPNLGQPGCLLPFGPSHRPSVFAMSTATPARTGASPVSWMGLFDDCIMSTHSIDTHFLPHERARAPPLRSASRTGKVVHLLSFAPDADSNGDAEQDLARAERWRAEADQDLAKAEQYNAETEQHVARAELDMEREETS